MNDRAVLGRHEVGHLHLSIAKVAQRRECLEVGGLYKSEVVRTDGIDIIHHNPFVLTDSFPYVRCLTTRALCINLLSMVVVEMINLVGYHIFDATRILLRYVGHEVATVGHWTDIGIEHLNRCVGVFKEQLRLGLEGRKVLVSIAVVEFCATASLLTDGEIDHRFTHGSVPNSLRCPGAGYLAESLRE